MDRRVATLPDEVEELCLIRLGLVVRKLSGWPYLFRVGREIEASVKAARAEGAGLLASDQFFASARHVVILQYWSSYAAMEAWSHRPPHSKWWQAAVERLRTRGDFGIYHESYLVPRSSIESIYVDVPEPVGLASFGRMAPAEGRMTTSRDRLGRREPRP